MKLFSKQLHKKKAGFTMMELLMVIAIIVILIGVAVPAVGVLRRNLRQRELDSKAEVIYTAAQSRLTQLRTGGYAELYGGVATEKMPDISTADYGATVREIEGLHKDAVPSDAINTNGEAANLCYVVSEENQNVAYVVLPEESVDKDLWKNNWIIEFDPETGNVYAVFYSTENFLDRADASRITQELDLLRDKKNRLADGARLGYYGGDLTQIAVVDKDSMTAVLKIINKEELILDMTCYTAEMPTFTVTIQDTAGNTYSKTIDPSAVTPVSGVEFHTTWTLDSLKNGGSFFTQTEGKLLCGTDITVTLTTSRPWEPGVDLTDKATATTNSLFAWGGDYGNDANTAYIAYGRHLQNLDNLTSHVQNEVKGVTSNVSKAVQVQDVSFQKSNKEDSYYVTYGDRLFDPIHNDRIVSYVGQKIGTTGVPAISGLHIESSEPNVGLFTTFSGTIQDLRVTGPKIRGGVSNVGTLMGAVSGTRATKIHNVQVFLSDTNGDLENQETDSAEKVNPWLTGRNVGGLIGSAGSGSLLIANSSASLPLEADRYAGGLVGMLNCTTNIANSYADGYLRGTYVGGLIGGAGQRANIRLQNFYAAGYAVAKETAAGLVVFNEDYNPLKSTTNGYSVMNLEKAAGSDSVKFYALAPRCDQVLKTYYLPQQGITYEPNTLGEALSYEILSSDQAFGYERTVDGQKETVTRLTAPFKSRRDTTNVSRPYNLLKQGLTSYTYPKLNTETGSDLAHYGDWKAEFEEGSLVYYERDENGNYRFEGGNISVDRIQADTSENDYTKRPKIVADGYALAYRSSKGTSWDGKASFGGKTVKLVDQQTMEIAGYTLYRLPEDFLNNDEALKKSTTFYQTLEVSETEKDDANRDVKVTKTYYFNPNFASCFASSANTSPEILRIRSPRHLYALSRLYETEAQFFTANTVIRQEMDLDYSIYEWNNAYKKNVNAVTTQEPVGSDTAAFVVTYDGRNNTVQGLGIATKGDHVGLFGKVGASGTVQNLVLLGEKGTDQSYLTHNATDARPTLSVADGYKTVNIGALVGWNMGTVSNCAVTGFRIELAAYNGVTVNIGGLVGRNEGGSISNCSAETPEISVRNYSSNTYAAGFAGNNSGTIYNSYAAGYLEVKEAKLETGKNTSRIAGFAARNDNGNLLRCYAGTPLMGSGDTEMYGFTASGGSVLRSYYLDGGTYEYRGQIYSLNASENGQRGQAGRTTSADGLEAMASTLSGYGEANGTYLGNDAKTYPYPEAVTRNGQYLHFGQWPNQDKDIGTFGVFYWEYESGGNSGYHLTFQGTADGEPMQGGSTLCTAHDDGGVITKYGYGYFYKPVANDPDAGKPHLEVENCVLGEEDATASAELQKQMPQYVFVAYKTGLDGLRMTGTDANRNKEANRNAIWKLYYPYVTNGTGTAINETASGVYTYSVSPFFGDAYNLIGISKADESTATEQNGGVTPGAQTRTYQVRSVDQLQFINWNYYKQNHTSAVSAHDTDSDRKKVFNTFPYLSCGIRYDKKAEYKIQEDLYWKQTHDVDGTGRSNYAPIGSMYDGNGNNADASVTLAYFSSTYDGQAYVIKNISITSREQCVGIFGATSGATLKNVVLYSDNGSKIIHTSDSKSWYAIGGLVGLAGAPTGSNTEFTNCTVSAYTIEDYQKEAPGWGGACIGGLAGVCTVDLTNCTAVADIDIRIGYTSGWQNVRVGGLVGCARATINACYAGGSMADNSGGWFGNRSSTTRIWIGGIVGGNVLRDGDPTKKGNLAELIGDTGKVTDVRNCYSFVNVPKKGSWNQKNRIHSSMAIASNGEMMDVCSPVYNDYITIYNCYALDTTARNGDDYEILIQKDSYNGINLNPMHKETDQDTWENGKKIVWADRRIEMTNAHNPIVTYQEMCTILMDQLNNGITESVGKFAPVTTTENAASINGKYSFPGGDSQLVGLDYPFPTILTQTDVDGNTVNVHYGAWPKFGIYWEEHKVTMDLLALRNTTGLDLLALYGDREEPVEVEEPEGTGPGATEPEETMPETTVPETTVPETTVPETTVPETTVPETTVPETTAPEAAVSETAALEGTEPEAGENQPPEPTEGETATLAAAFQALDANTIQAVQVYKLYVVGIGTDNISDPTYELQDETGTPIAAADEGTAAARILDASALDGDHYNVTFLAQHPGTVRVLATVNKSGTDYSALLTVTVTADLRIKVEESKLPMKTYVGDPMADAMVTLEDSKGNQFKPGDGAALTWTLAIDSQESEQDLVTWTANGFIETRQQAVTGGGTEDVFYLTSLKGFSSGEGSLKLSLTYTWDESADPVETSVIIPIEVYPSDVLGLGDGVMGQEAEIPHSNPASATGKPRTDAENIPTLDGKPLFLYASNETDADGKLVSYTDLSKFQVTKAELKRTGYGYQEMTKVVPGEDDPAPATDDFTLKIDDDHTVTFKVDKNVVSDGDRNQSFTYRPITVEGDTAEQWTLRLTLQPVGEDGTPINRTYVLEYARPNTVTFAFRAGETDTVLKTYRVDQGQDLSDLDQDTLDEELEDLAKAKGLDVTTAEGHHYTWALPEDAITANRTVTQESQPIRYYVNYDAGYEDYEWDDNVPMEKDTFTYGEDAKHLKANEYNRPGYVFAGWSATIGGKKAYDDQAAFIDRTGVTDADGQTVVDIFTASKTEWAHNAIITLYAVWEPKEYTISYNGNFSGWNAEGTPTMDPDTYSIDAPDGTVKQCLFQREGYTFLGWSFDAAKAEPDILPGESLETAMHQGGEYVVYSDVTLYAVWKQNATEEVTDTLETPVEPAEAETEVPEDPTEEPEDPIEEQPEPTEAPTEPEPVEETEPPEEPTQEPEKAPEEEGE